MSRRWRQALAAGDCHRPVVVGAHPYLVFMADLRLRMGRDADGFGDLTQNRDGEQHAEEGPRSMKRDAMDEPGLRMTARRALPRGTTEGGRSFC